MAYIVRRVFYAKVGKADNLVTHFQEGEKWMTGYGFNLKTRILTDMDSGRSDRVVVEWEAEDRAQYDSAMGSIVSSPEAQKAFQAWEPKMNELIHYSKAETWAIR